MKKESEKVLERKLRTFVESTGGIGLKLVTTHFAGLPDRLCLFPGGRALFVEVKSTGMKPRKIQLLIMKKLNALGFDTMVLDSTETLNEIKEKYG